MNTGFIQKILFYLINAVILYLLLKYVPKTPIRDQDILIFIGIILLVTAIFDCVSSFYNGSNNHLTADQCNSYCSVKAEQHKSVETMVSLPSVNQTNTNTVSSEVTQSTVQTTQNVVQPVIQNVSPNNTTDIKEVPYTPVQRSDGVVQVGPDQWKITQTNEPQITSTTTRYESDVMGNEVPYTDFNSLPMVDLDPNTGSFEEGYSMLPPSSWYPTPPHPPVCVTERHCPVCPIFTTGLGTDLKEWNATRRITPPDRINTNVVTEKLNAGR